MSNDPNIAAETPLTPCIGTCRLDARGYCEGCQRTGAEIASWHSLDNAQRRFLMQVVLPPRRVD